jgi:hypothetical protein
VVSDPRVIQAVKNRARLQDAAKKRALEVGQAMPEAPDRIAQAFDVAARGPEGAGQGQSFLEGVGDAASFGFGDEVGAAMDLPVSSLFSGKSGNPNTPSAYDINLARRRQSLEHAQQQNPLTTLGGQVAGAVGGGVLAPGLGGVGVAARGAGLGTRLLYGAGTGAVQGGLYGAGSGETPQERLTGAESGAAIGAGLGAAAPVAVRGIQAAAGGVRNAVAGRTVAGPTVDQLRQQADAFYTRMRQQGVQLSGPAFQRIAQNIAVRARTAGIDPGVHPKTSGALRRLLSDASGQRGSAVPTLDHLDTLRQIMRDAATDPGERRIARLMVEGLDENLNRLQPRDIAAGNPRAGLAALREGRQLWQRMRKGETIDNIFENARDRAGANYTQAGMHTALRHEFKSLGKRIREGRERGWTNAERAAIQRVVRGGPMENLLRIIGKAAPRNVFSATPSVAAGMYFDPVTGALVAGAGEIGKRASTAIGMRNAERVGELARAGVPLARPPAMQGLRHLDAPAARVAAQHEPEAARKPLKIYLTAGEQDRTVGR